MKYSIVFLAAIAAVHGSPVALPQGVTSAIAPSAPAPSGCMPSYSGSFGVAVVNVTGGGVMSATQKSDGQPQATSGAISQISDGQPQATTGAPPPVSQISDGQPQASTGMMSVVPVTQISDGQIQATTMMPAVTQISDGQIQATYTAPAVSQISDGQPQATTGAVSQISDGQPQATATSGAGAPAASPMMVACQTDSTLVLTLEGGILKDAKGRTGYIASNYQFQFDDPPQAGAIYTSGWSVCGNGSVALGGSTIFYQCLSGSFYNLYDRHWAAQCNPVTIDVLKLVSCSS